MAASSRQPADRLFPPALRPPLPQPQCRAAIEHELDAAAGFDLDHREHLLGHVHEADGRALIIHASRLARHTAGLAEGAPFDRLVHEPVADSVDPLQVRRVTLRGEVRAFAEHDAVRALDRAGHLAKFPEAEPVTALGDFAFFRLEITGGRLVSGFRGALNLNARALPSLLAFSVPS